MPRKKYTRRNKHQKAQDKKIESELSKHGHSLREIATCVDLSKEQVRLDLAEINRELLKESKVNIEQARTHQLAKLRHAQIEVLDAWKRSLQDAELRKEKDGKDGKEITTLIKGQSGNPSHIKNYIKSVEVESRLLGLLDKLESGNDPIDKNQFWEQIGEELTKAKQNYDPPE